ncbi:MAG: ribonuclease Y [Candidatus Kerfeldbacteria bacterium]|nr:ribonuclease Y [Candidatus Kerfeldbacteria bacterium]
MENILYLVLLAVVAMPLGVALGWFLRKFFISTKLQSAESRAEHLLTSAREQEKELLLKAKDKALKTLEEADLESKKRHAEVEGLKNRLEKRENMFDTKLLDLERQQQEVVDKTAKIENLKAEIYKIKEDHIKKLEEISNMTRDGAKQELLDRMERMSSEELGNRLQKMQDEFSQDYERHVRNILSTVIQRVTASHVSETTTTAVELPNDEMKGRIIGKEGRNIRAIEQLTGIEIIVDETPETILISGFNPIRRHLAKRALDKLISDGRIHPARIEACVEEAKKDLSTDIQKAGEDAAYEVGVAGLHPKLVQLLGRLKYRTSYGQNVLIHSKEVGILSALLAEELGADVAVCRKGGLLHDIGKAVDHEIQGGHPEIGYEIMLKFGLPEEIAYIAVAHHEDRPKTLEGIVCKVADQISGSRPGARSDTYEAYVQRLTELEEVAKRFDGVEKVYAIQAGREVRVFVSPEKVDDAAAYQLARNIANTIESELKYPGEIKVNLLREKRIIEYAR